MTNLVTSFSHFSLFKEKNEPESYSILYDSCCRSLIQSIAFSLGDENCIIHKNKKITFPAKNVQPLELFLLGKHKKFGYNLCLSLLYNLETQNDFLKKESFCIFCIRLGDILVVDESKFIFINPKKTRPTDIDGKISFLSPFDKRGFCSPEILAITSLPSSVDVNTFYYSLGALVIFCISNITEISDDISHYLKSIYGTKLYWTILRLLPIEPEKRSFLYV